MTDAVHESTGGPNEPEGYGVVTIFTLFVAAALLVVGLSGGCAWERLEWTEGALCQTECQRALQLPAAEVLAERQPNGSCACRPESPVTARGGRHAFQ